MMILVHLILAVAMMVVALLAETVVDMMAVAVAVETAVVVTNMKLLFLTLAIIGCNTDIPTYEGKPIGEYSGDWVPVSFGVSRFENDEITCYRSSYDLPLICEWKYKETCIEEDLNE
jgi:hypothetical protein